MEYILIYASGGWCPDYRRDPPPRTVRTYEVKDPWVSIPIDHPDLLTWYKRRGTLLKNFRLPYVDKTGLKCVTAD